MAAVLAYMVQHGPQAGPFFLCKDGSRLTRNRLVAEVRRALERAGVDPAHYSGHSFRIGAATTAEACGLQDPLIKTLGRWKSAGYTVFIQNPPFQLHSVAAKLVTHCITAQYHTGSHILDLGQGRWGALQRLHN